MFDEENSKIKPQNMNPNREAGDAIYKKFNHEVYTDWEFRDPKQVLREDHSLIHSPTRQEWMNEGFQSESD